MNQITLHRKGGRKPWVFEWQTRGHYMWFYIHKTVKKTYRIDCKNDIHKGPLVGILDQDDRQCANKIKADHFRLGNVTITF